MRIGAVARIHSALAVRFQEFEIAFDGSSHRQWPCNAIGRPRTEHHARASPVLRLRETEDDRPVGITKVVCDADLLHYVAPAADVMACDPCSCDSGPSLAASACGSRYASQARAAGSVACPGWRDDFGSLGSRAVHRGFCAPSFVSNKCPIYGQEYPKTSMHRYGHLISTLKAFRNTHGHLCTLCVSLTAKTGVRVP